MKHNILSLFTVIAFLALFGSCKDFLTTGPTNNIPSDMVNTLEDAKRVVNGLYSRMKWEDYYGANMMAMGENRADDLRPRIETSGYVAIYQYNFSPDINHYSGFWTRIYSILLNANSLLEIIDNFPANSQGEIDLRNDIKGQAYAVRGLCHFDLARLYGFPYLMDNGASLGAVLATEVIPQGEARARASVKETYDVAINDLNESLNLLLKARNHGHFNYWAAKALLSRVYLYKGDYDNAFKHADEILTTVGSTYSLVPNEDYISSWSRQDCSEMLLELLITIPSNINDNYGVGAYFYGLTQEPGTMVGGYLLPTAAWCSLIDEDPDDVRNGLLHISPASGDRWLRKFAGNSVTPPNYGLHNPVILRLSEVYLIASEAALMKSAPDQGKANLYLDAIRKRANPNVPTVTATVNEVLKERRKELGGEGHRFFDLARLGRLIDRTAPDNVLPPTSSHYLVVDPWDKVNYYKVVLPLHYVQLSVNPLGEQNPGY